MSDDLVKRLRDKYASPQDVAEAADLIEELEIEIRFKELQSEELACYKCVEKSKAAADEIEHLKQEQKRLGQNSVAYFNKLYAKHKDEIERLTKKCDMQAMILRRLTPENYPDTLFIHGTLGDKDHNNMPEKLQVVPAYGVDFSYIYERTGKTTGPKW